MAALVVLVSSDTNSQTFKINFNQKEIIGLFQLLHFIYSERNKPVSFIIYLIFILAIFIRTRVTREIMKLAYNIIVVKMFHLTIVPWMTDIPVVVLVS